MPKFWTLTGPQTLYNNYSHKKKGSSVKKCKNDKVQLRIGYEGP
jgi:hypothetical protein